MSWRPRLTVLLAALSVLAVAAYLRLRQMDEALRPTPATIQNILHEASATQEEADRLPDYPLPDALASALRKPSDFHVYSSVADIPAPVRSAFANAAREPEFLMADPNGKWNPTDVIFDEQLPRRRLTATAIGGNFCLLFYEHGGLGKNDNVAVFRFSDGHAQAIWHAYVPHRVTSPASLSRALQEKNYSEEPFF